ncbi:protein JINGUBANG [Amborella trichopoda]|uniref:Uncharacterized protein n=1 Tax=Amborella trichopoda TaxID=13333 RepID=W1PKP4_AMBTC|nr:protein JINGUBANG [Amborella trichopoda]ERN08314.1 hypothetical protein AMTR_s00156p00066850 [Amborella trichopoda]|eukprot:XP_020524287.1 protein JINGUBANG [Amborella trichopoda]
METSSHRPEESPYVPMDARMKQQHRFKEATPEATSSSPSPSPSPYPSPSPSPSPKRASNFSLVMSPCSSPESPWSLSPLHRHPAPPHLLFRCVATLSAKDGNVLAIAVAKGAVFTGSESKRVRVWQHPDCLERGSLRSSSGGVRSIHAVGDRVFTAHDDCRIRVWRVPKPNLPFRQERLATLPTTSFFPRLRPHNLHRAPITSLAYHQAEGLLYSGSVDCTVRSWCAADARCIDCIAAHDDAVTAVALNPEDGTLFTASSDGTIKLWKRVWGQSAHTLTMTLRFQASPVNALALAPRGRFLYSGSSDGFVNFWEKEGTSCRYNHGGLLQGHRFAVLCLACAERIVVSGSEDATIRVWRREGGSLHECLAVLEGHRGPVGCVAAWLEAEGGAVGVVVYSGSLDRTVKVWRLSIVNGGGEMKVEGEERVVEFETSPVLSPSWVEKKLQAAYMQ